jgi:hypothetical protein
MLSKKFTPDFKSQARTLDPLEVFDGYIFHGCGAKNVTIPDRDKIYTRTHESGWTICAEIKEDWFEWIDDFEASHPIYGKLYGTFEYEVFYETDDALDHFMKHHPFEEWDYYDI